MEKINQEAKQVLDTLKAAFFQIYGVEMGDDMLNDLVTEYLGTEFRTLVKANLVSRNQKVVMAAVKLLQEGGTSAKPKRRKSTDVVEH